MSDDSKAYHDEQRVIMLGLIDGKLKTHVQDLTKTTKTVPATRIPAATSSTKGGVKISTADPQPLGTPDAGSGIEVSSANHVHEHGDLAGGSLHDVATSSVAGFQSAADKAKEDSYPAVTGLTPGDVLTALTSTTVGYAPPSGGAPTAHASTHESGGSDALDLALLDGLLGLAHGGTGADLSATGGAHQIVRQNSAGGVLSASVLAAADIPNLPSSIITSGEIPRSPLTTRGDLLTRDASTHARVGIGAAGKYLRSDGTDPSWQALAFADLIFSGLTAGQVLRATGAAAASFGALNLATAAAITGLLPPGNGGTGTANTGNLAWPSTGGTAALLDTANVFTQAQTIVVPSALTTTQANALVLALRSSATPAANFGEILRFQLQSSTTVDQDAGAIAARWSDATHASRTSYLAFYTTLSGSFTEKMHLTGEGYLGIGTTAPETFLQLHSTSVATLMRLSSFAPGIEWENNAVAASRTMFAFIGLGTSAGHYGQAAGDFNIGVGSSGAGNSNNLNFLTATNDSGGYARRAMITKAGLFGIGATAPTTAFEIQTGVVTAGLYQVDTLGATEVEILPAGTISYTLVVISILCRDSAAALNNGANARLDVPASTSVTYGIAVGTNTVTVRLYSTGRLTIQRTAGSGTIKCSVCYNGL